MKYVIKFSIYANDISHYNQIVYLQEQLQHYVHVQVHLFIYNTSVVYTGR